MARKAAEVVLEMSAQNAQYLAKLRESTAAYNRSMASIRQQAGLTGTFVKGVLGGMLAGFSVAGAQQLIDTSVRIENSLKTTGLAGEELRNVYDQLFAAAQRNAAPVESLVQLYSRVALVQNELGVSSQQLVSFTENVAMALRAGGTDAQAASGALAQLAQALGGSIVRAEEFSSLMEGAPTILQTAAAGIVEAEGSVAKLRQIMLDGRLASRALFDGFEAGSAILEQKLAGAGTTVSQSFVRLRNVLIDVAGDMNDGTKASATLATAIQDLGTWIQQTDFTPVITGVTGFGREVLAVVQQIQQLSDAAGKATGVQDWLKEFRGGSMAYGTVKPQVIQDRIDGAFAASEGNVAKKGDRLGNPDKPQIRLSDKRYQIDESDEKDANARQKSREAAAKAAEREAEAVRELISDLEFERSLIGMTDLERQKAVEVRRAGAAATDEQRERIGALVEAMNAEQAALDPVHDPMEEINDAARDVLGGMIDDLREGKSAADILANALANVADRLTSGGLDALFGRGGGSNSLFGSILGQLFGGGSGTRYASGIKSGQYVGLFHSGGVVGSSRVGRQVNPAVFAGAERYHNGGMPGLRSDEVPAILQKGEIVLPKNVLAGGGGGATTTINYAPVNNFQGTSEELAAFRRESARQEAEFSGKVVQVYRGAKKRRMI